MTRHNILSVLEEKTNAFSDRIALGIRTQLGWKEFSYKGIGLLSRKLASHLIMDIQVKKGERVAICQNQNRSTEHVYLPRLWPE